MQIEFLEKEDEKNIFLENPTQEFEETFLINKKYIVFIKWNFTRIWNEIAAATYHNPAEHTLTEETAEIISTINSDGVELNYTIKEEKEIINFLKSIDYGN